MEKPVNIQRCSVSNNTEKVLILTILIPSNKNKSKKNSMGFSRV